MYSICFTRFLLCSLSFDLCTSPSSASYVSLPFSLSLTYLHQDDDRAQTRTHHSNRAVDRDGKRPGKRSPRTDKRPSENLKNVRASTHHDGSSSLSQKVKLGLGAQGVGRGPWAVSGKNGPKASVSRSDYNGISNEVFLE